MITKGTLKVIEHRQQHELNGGGTYVIQCECNHVFERYASRWKDLSGRGCPRCWRKYARGNYRHGGYTENRAEYNSWRAMKERCNNPNYWAYSRYGGRGIRVCDRWNDAKGFKFFLEDMGKKPTPKHSIDRIDNDGDYTPENCKWSSQTEQTSNIEKNRVITINGKSKIIAEWCREKDISVHTVYSRIKLGWSVEKAIVTPTKGKGANQASYT